MGQPKAWLDFGGQPLLSRIVQRLQPAFSEFVVVSAPGQPLPETGATVVHDETPGEGPVGGMVAGLAAIRRPLALVLSCDLPFVSHAVVGYLVERAAGHDVVVPEWQGRLHPLQAVYRTATQAVLADLFRGGRRRPVDLFERVDTLTVGEDELRALDSEGLTFFNVNTPEDYANARRRLAACGEGA